MPTRLDHPSACYYWLDHRLQVSEELLPLFIDVPISGHRRWFGGEKSKRKKRFDAVIHLTGFYDDAVAELAETVKTDYHWFWCAGPMAVGSFISAAALLLRAEAVGKEMLVYGPGAGLLVELYKYLRLGERPSDSSDFDFFVEAWPPNELRVISGIPRCLER